MRGEFMLPVSAEVRERSGVAAGDQVDVHVELDPEPRAVSVPADLAEALDREAAARREFEAMYSRAKQRGVMPSEQARTADIRQRRVAKAVSELREGV